MHELMWIHWFLVAIWVLLVVGPSAAILIWLEPCWRVAAFFLGLALAAFIYWPATSGDPRGWWLVAFELSLGTPVSALLIEIPAFLIRTMGRGAAGDRRQA